MEKTFDWILTCKHNPDTKRKIEKAMQSDCQTELKTDIFRLCFLPHTRQIRIFCAEKNSLFSSQIIPTQIAYTTAQKMLRGDWNSIAKEELVRLNEEDIKMENKAIRQRTERTKWFLNDRFGMFIHWGLYSIPARGEWVRHTEQIPTEEYERYFREFNPVDYNPKEWAKLAKQAGMKYAVLTAKHHDGFCLFDSALTDYKSTNTQCKRDLVREYLEAFRAEGLKVGLYYSLLDWHHPDYPHYGDINHPMRNKPEYSNENRVFERYIEYFHAQVKELLTNYGKLDIMWFDFSYDDMCGEKWQATKLMQMIRSLQPWLIVDNRLEAGGHCYGSILSDNPKEYSGDFASPEQMIPPNGMVDIHGNSIPWEACITLNDHWGYCSADNHWKSPKMVIRNLVDCVSKNGNMLLNVGPDATGKIPQHSVEILRQVGNWIQKNADSVYGCGASSLPKPEWGRYTQNKNRLYAHIFEECINAYLLDIPPEKVDSVRLLSDKSEVIAQTPWNALEWADKTFVTFGGTTFPLPDQTDTVLEIVLKEE